MHAFNYLSLDQQNVGETPLIRFARYEQRLPTFVRVDAAISYRWDAGWSWLRVGLEWINIAPVQGEVVGLACVPDTLGVPNTPCPTQGPPPYPIPNLFLRAVTH